MNAKVLKVNYPKWRFGSKDIPYLGFIITLEGIQPEQNKLQGIIDLGRPTKSTEAWELTGMIHYYRRDMWTSWSHVLAPITEASSLPKGRSIIWNDELEVSFRDINHMVNTETLLN